jgi:predicted RNase H-like HicB family nuclease
MSKYAVIYEPTRTGYSSFAPDLPGCIATGRTLEQTRQRMHDAIEVHLDSMREDGDPIPDSSHVVDMLEVA